jgi:hypothetical protein
MPAETSMSLQDPRHRCHGKTAAWALANELGYDLDTIPQDLGKFRAGERRIVDRPRPPADHSVPADWRCPACLVGGADRPRGTPAEAGRVLGEHEGCGVRRRSEPQAKTRAIGEIMGGSERSGRDKKPPKLAKNRRNALVRNPLAYHQSRLYPTVASADDVGSLAERRGLVRANNCRAGQSPGL